jgi:ubiquitin C
VKKKIRDQEGIPPEQQLIVINDIEVDDHRAISNYNIGNDSTIHLIRMGYATNTVGHSPVSMREI